MCLNTKFDVGLGVFEGVRRSTPMRDLKNAIGSNICYYLIEINKPADNVYLNIDEIKNRIKKDPNLCMFLGDSEKHALEILTYALRHNKNHDKKYLFAQINKDTIKTKHLLEARKYMNKNVGNTVNPILLIDDKDLDRHPEDIVKYKLTSREKKEVIDIHDVYFKELILCYLKDETARVDGDTVNCVLSEYYIKDYNETTLFKKELELIKKIDLSYLSNISEEVKEKCKMFGWDWKYN